MIKEKPKNGFSFFVMTKKQREQLFSKKQRQNKERKYFERRSFFERNGMRPFGKKVFKFLEGKTALTEK